MVTQLVEQGVSAKFDVALVSNWKASGRTALPGRPGEFVEAPWKWRLEASYEIE
jgi:hypothetical protein